MPIFKVRSDTAAALLKRMESLGINESDLSESFIRGSGPGGQKKNKSSSCVQLKHLPSGIEVRCQKDRSQSMNRYYARIELCDRIEQQQTGAVQHEAAERFRERRRKQRRSRRAKVKLVADKRAHSATKALRKRPGNSD